MAFLNKKELSLIKLINSDEKLSATKRTELVQKINYNARLRSDRFRLPVKEFIQAMAVHQSNKILNVLNKY
jgi:hypothetical protein